MEKGGVERGGRKGINRKMMEGEMWRIQLRMEEERMKNEEIDMA